jgi:hypothetical protein
MAQAVKLAILSGGIRNLDFQAQMRVFKALQILEAVPDKFDEVPEDKKR